MTQDKTQKLLYHFSYPSAILQILQSGKLYSKNMDESGKLSISTTTDINFYKKAISGFKPSKKGAFLVLNSQKLQKDGVEMSNFVYKGVRDTDYSKESEVRLYPENNELPIKKYLIAVGLTKYASKEQNFADKLLAFCEKNGIKTIII